jgi:hypothetical protein
VVSDEPAKGHQSEADQANQQADVPAVAEKPGQGQEQAAAGQHERERYERIAKIAARRRRDRRWQNLKFLVECVAALATVAIAVSTYSYVNYSAKQWQTMERAQRPHVALGRRDGVVAEFKEMGPYPGITFWFHNDGFEAAHDFSVNVCTMDAVLKAKCLTHYLRPYKTITKGSFSVTVVPWAGVDIAGDSDRAEFSTMFSKEQIEQIKRETISELQRSVKGKKPDKDDPSLLGLIQGTMEYTDSLGDYCCKPFCVSWGPSSASWEPCWDASHMLILNSLPTLPRCPQVTTTCD